MKHKLRNAVLITTLAVGCLHVINKCIITASTLKNLLPMRPGKFYNWRFGRVFYRKSGTGRPLLLIHDLTASSSSYEWNQMEKQLAKDYTVYTLDLPGCGRSDKPNLTYTNYLYVQLISEFIEKVIKSRTSVAATGLSGSFLIMACNANPDIYDKLLLINPESLQNLSKIPGKRSKTVKFIIDCPIIGTSLYHILTSHNYIEHDFMEHYFYNPFNVKRRPIDVYYEAAHRHESGGKYLYASLKGNYLNINISHALKKIDNSIFIIGGSHENSISEIMDSYMELNPAIETTLIEKTKHLPQLESPEKVYKAMRIFLS